MRMVGACGRGLIALLSGIGITTVQPDLSELLRNIANWIDAGGNIGLVLWSITLIFGLWAAFDVFKWVTDNRKAKMSNLLFDPPVLPEKMNVWQHSAKKFSTFLRLDDLRTEEKWDEAYRRQKENEKRP